MIIDVNENLDLKKDILVLGVFDDDKELYKKYNKELSSELHIALEKKRFTKDFGKIYSTRITSSVYEKIIVLQLGKKEEMSVERIRRVASKIVDFLKCSKTSSFTTNIALLIEESRPKHMKISDLSRGFAEGLILSEYVFDKYKSKKDSEPERIEFNASIQINSRIKQEFLEGIKHGRIIAEATNYAKDLVNEPANVVTPGHIESTIKKLFGKDPKIKIKVMEKPEMEKQGLNALLGVASGSDQDPKLIFIQYNNNPKERPVAIVGKGITFDSGGYNIKPTGSIEDMKCDMSGAAAVIGTILAATQLGLKKNILGVIPSCENMINGSAQRPGDIVKAYNGKTIEIGNTDAEGRLVLADAISYTEKNYKPEIIIDLATLTGACVVALGYYCAALISNDEGLSKDLLEAGNDSYDRVWQLPFFEEYQDNMDNDISDLKNVSVKKDRAAGTITGGVFLSKFVDKAKWAHIDIAGTAYLVEAKEYNQKYASGSGVRLLTYYLMKG